MAATEVLPPNRLAVYDCKHMGKAKKTKRSRFLTLPVLCILVVLLYLAWAIAQPLTNLQPTFAFKDMNIPAQNISLSWPSYGQSAIGATGYGVLATNGDQKPIPTASIAKVITALAVLRQRPLGLGEQGPVITLTQTDVDSYNKYVSLDGSVVGVSAGEQITEYQALEALLLPSANNMAETLARWAFGSLDNYNAYANSYAASLGLASVHVTDPSGYLPTTVASAHDLTVLGQLAMQNPVFAQIVGLPSATIPVQGTVTNYNFLVGDSYNVGIKTGNNDQDPGAYLFAFKYPVGGTAIMVVGTIMGGPNLAAVQASAKRLVQSAYPHFKAVTIVRSGQAVGAYRADKQPAATAIATDDLSLITWDGFAYTARASLATLHGATAANSQVGKVMLTNTTTHATNSSSVVLQQTIRSESLRTRLTHPF